MRPASSYAVLITEAITSHPQKQMILSEIYAYFEAKYPYYRNSRTGWKVNLRMLRK